MPTVAGPAPPTFQRPTAIAQPLLLRWLFPARGAARATQGKSPGLPPHGVNRLAPRDSAWTACALVYLPTPADADRRVALDSSAASRRAGGMSNSTDRLRTTSVIFCAAS